MNPICSTIEDNFSELFVFFADKGNLKVHIASRVSWVDSRPYCWPNFIFNTRFKEDSIGRDILEVVDSVRSGSAPPFWLVGPKTGDPDLGNRLHEQGMMLIDSWPGMACDLSEWQFQDTQKVPLQVKTVSTKKELKDWYGLVNRELFPKKKLDKNLFLSVLHEPRIRFYVGYRDATPVSTAMTFRSSRATGLYMIATSAIARGQGFGTAITANALQHAAEEGERLAILQSTKSGFGVYRRLGFKQLCRFDVYWMVGDAYR